MSSNVSKPGMKKFNVQVTSKESSTIASASNVPIICPVQSTNTIKSDKVEKAEAYAENGTLAERS